MAAEALDVLKSIDASLKQIVGLLRVAKPAEVASDRDLDSQYGDPQVKFMPRDWTGDSFKGYRFSECPASLLDMIAETFDYFAEKAERDNEQYNGKPTAPYKRKDAARARGWAKRHRSGWRPVEQPQMGRAQAPATPEANPFDTPLPAWGETAMLEPEPLGALTDADIPF